MRIDLVGVDLMEIDLMGAPQQLIGTNSMVDFLTGLQLGFDIICQHRLNGEVSFPISKNPSLCIGQCPTSSGLGPCKYCPGTHVP